MTTTDVVIAIPNYNGEKYLEDSIRSILNQTYKKFSLLIVDNCSTDNSVNIICSFKDPRIQIHHNQTHQSITQNFNTCAKLGQDADYFCIMHSDDIYEPRYLEKMIFALNSNPDAMIAHCDFNVIDSKGSIQEDYKFNLKRKFLITKGTDLKRSPIEELTLLIRADYIICPSVMYRGRIFKEIGYFNEAYSLVEDWDFFLRVLLAGNKILYVAQRLFNYRVHSANMTSYNLKHLIKYQEHLKMLKGVLNEIKRKGLEFNYTIKDIEQNTLKILLWDIKEDLLMGCFFEAKKKYCFAKENIIGFKKSLFSVVIFLLIQSKKMGGVILDFSAKSYLYLSGLFQKLV